MISKQLILEGSKFRKNVHLTIYDEDIEVRPLTEVEIAKVFKKVEDAGFSTTDPKLSDNYILQIEACRYGIVDKSLHEIANPEDPKEEQKEVFECMVGNSLIEIGREIINISTVGSTELSDFFRLQKDNVCSGSIIQDTELTAVP
jgi:hypothetical protein